MSVQLLRRLFTVDEYHKIVEAGVLTESDRVELIRGEIVQISPIGFRHAAYVKPRLSWKPKFFFFGVKIIFDPETISYSERKSDKKGSQTI